jgi:hypothetical protein
MLGWLAKDKRSSLLRVTLNYGSKLFNDIDQVGSQLVGQTLGVPPVSPYGNQGFGNPGYGTLGLGNQGYGNQGYGTLGLGNQGYGNQGYGTLGLSNQGPML